MSSRLPNGMIVSRTTILARGVELSTDTYATGLNNNQVIFGGSGSGKSSSCVMPNGMQINSSLVVIDPKGALYADLAPGLRAAGYRVELIDFSQPANSTVAHDPIAECRDDRDLRDLAFSLVTEHGVSERDPFWQEQASSVIVACVKLVREEGGTPTIGAVIEALDQIHVPGDEGARPKGFPVTGMYSRLDERFVALGWEEVPREDAPSEGPQAEDGGRAQREAKAARARAEASCDRLEREVCRRLSIDAYDVDRLVRTEGMSHVPPDPAARRAVRELRRRHAAAREARRREAELSSKHALGLALRAGDLGPLRDSRPTRRRRASEAYERWSNLRNTAPETWACIVGETAPRLDAYRSPELLRLLSCDGLPAAELDLPGRELCARFVVISDVNRDLDLMAGLFVRQSMRALVRYADAQPDRRCEQPVRIVLDDFANMAPMREMDVWIAAVRSREIWITLVVQSLSQLEERYGKAAETIVGNCDVQLFFTPADVRTAEYVSMRTGLAVPAVMGMPKEWVLVMARAGVPMVCERYDLTSHPNWRHFWEAAHALPPARER